MIEQEKAQLEEKIKQKKEMKAMFRHQELLCEH